MHQIIVAHPTFTVSGISCSSSGGDNHRCQSVLKKLERMIETGTINRRRSPCVFSRTEHNNGIGCFGFLKGSLANDLQRGSNEKRNKTGCNHRQQPQQPAACDGPLAFYSAHPCAKNSEISLLGIPPSLSTRHRASSSVRSTMVEATSRGETPPSTMIEIRF